MSERPQLLYCQDILESGTASRMRRPFFITLY
jgi:hypothetical protein